MIYDVVVIGAGAAGLAAATTARGSGLRVVLVSAGPPGGDCTFTGCVPSKTLLAAAADGLAFADALRRVRATVQWVAASEDEPTLLRGGIEVLPGPGRLAGDGTVEVDGQVVRARRIVLATGARPALPPIPGLDAVPYLTTDTVFELREPPGSLIILGAGPVGCELAQAFARLGVAVTLVEAADRILPGFEPEASEILADVLRADGVYLRTATAVIDARVDGEQVRVRVADGEPVRAHRVLVATGRRPQTTDLGLETAGVATGADGRVLVDRYLASSARGIVAAGDVTGLFGHTHAAYAMRRIAIVNGTHRRRRAVFDREVIPRVVFTDPEIAAVGVDEPAAPVESQVAYLPMAEVDRAITAAREVGFVKLVAGPRRLLGRVGGGRLLGATIVAERAGELIHEPVLAMHTGMFTGRLAQAVHAYPTWSMAVQQAAAQFVGTYGGRTARPARPQPRE